MFEKKFKVRIRYFGDGRYIVEYAHYRLFPLFDGLTQWLIPLRSWNPLLLPYIKAQDQARKICSIADVTAWNASQQALRVKYPPKDEIPITTPPVEYFTCDK